jgi:GABA permease
MPERLKMRMWGFPYLTRFAIAAMLAIVGAMAFIPDQRAPLVFGIVSVIVLLVAFALRRAAGTPATPAA